MLKRLVLICLIMTYNRFAWSQQDIDFSFNGERYSINIISNCEIYFDCENVTGHFLDKKSNNKFQSDHGETINIGYGRNLRGFIFTRGELTYTLRQPNDGNGENLDRWSLIITEKNKQGGEKVIFQERGDIDFL
ncbi:hypothetical protein [[Erwinia] mediterraneensis]|uniref:hypothetical protein n=1 Tax=[Erwinia] mediterraneensis TaxID=2161819 RepID=UPI00102F7579|nr:hypothetical protein [[Erwinia] mediterraneensis]